MRHCSVPRTLVPSHHPSPRAYRQPSLSITSSHPLYQQPLWFFETSAFCLADKRNTFKFCLRHTGTIDLFGQSLISTGRQNNKRSRLRSTKYSVFLFVTTFLKTKNIYNCSRHSSSKLSSWLKFPSITSFPSQINIKKTSIGRIN